jgi:acetyl esterase/lipase
VHFIHGGYWHEGDRRYYAPMTGLYGRIGIALARQGIGVVVQSYRLSPAVDIDGVLADVTGAVRWTLDNVARWGGAPDRVVVAGHSAGGHLTALLALDPAPLRAAGVEPGRIRGFVPMSPVLDLAHMRQSQDAAFNESVTDRVFGRDPARLGRYAPVTYLRRDAPPLLLLIGAQDYPYLLVQARAAAEKLRALGAPFDYVEVPGKTHEAMVLDLAGSDDAVTPLVAAFVARVTAAGTSP